MTEMLVGEGQMGLVIDPIELLALKKLAIICLALAEKIPEPAKREQKILTNVLVAILNRAEIDNARAKATEPRP